MDEKYIFKNNLAQEKIAFSPLVNENTVFYLNQENKRGDVLINSNVYFSDQVKKYALPIEYKDYFNGSNEIEISFKDLYSLIDDMVIYNYAKDNFHHFFDNLTVSNAEKFDIYEVSALTEETKIDIYSRYLLDLFSFSSVSFNKDINGFFEEYYAKTKELMTYLFNNYPQEFINIDNLCLYNNGNDNTLAKTLKIGGFDLNPTVEIRFMPEIGKKYLANDASKYESLVDILIDDDTAPFIEELYRDFNRRISVEDNIVFNVFKNNDNKGLANYSIVLAFISLPFSILLIVIGLKKNLNFFKYYYVNNKEKAGMMITVILILFGISIMIGSLLSYYLLYVISVNTFNVLSFIYVFNPYSFLMLTTLSLIYYLALFMVSYYGYKSKKWIK